MKKKLVSAILCASMVAGMVVIPGVAVKADDKKLIGVTMPTKDLQRWNQDGENMKKELEAAGYEVDLQYASNDVSTQVSQLENQVANGCDLLVVASIDGSSLGAVSYTHLYLRLYCSTFLPRLAATVSAVHSRYVSDIFRIFRSRSFTGSLILSSLSFSSSFLYFASF